MSEHDKKFGRATLRRLLQAGVKLFKRWQRKPRCFPPALADVGEAMAMQLQDLSPEENRV